MRKTLLFLIILCTYSLHAQQTDSNCPVVIDVSQSFCQTEGSGNNYYQPSVAHLEAVAGEDGLRWYDTATSTLPLDPSEILIDGEDYYAGNNSGTCTTRAVVYVTVDAAPNAGATTSVTFCSTDGPVDLLEVYRPSILGPPDAGGTFSPALASGSTIFDPAVDAAGKYIYKVASANGECPDDDSAITITIVEAPDAGEDAVVEILSSDAPQDLFTYLGGTPDVNGTWSPALASGSGIFDPSVDASGVYTYTVAGNNYCAADSATVEVSIVEPCPVVQNDTQRFCASEGTGNNFYQPSVAHLEAVAGEDGLRWYDTATSTLPLDPSEILIDSEDYYAGNNSGTCTTRAVVYVTVDAAPNAGATTSVTFCSTDGPVDLLEVYQPSILGPPDAGGTFSPALASGSTIFDPAVDAAGKYTYKVASANGECPDDSSTIMISINQCEAKVEMDVIAYPNPSTGVFNFSRDSDRIDLVRVVNINGIVLKTFEAPAQSGLNAIDISDLLPGIYLAEVHTPKGKVIKRLIKR